LLVSDKHLLQQAIMPAVLLAGFCALTAALGFGPGQSFIARFYQTFALLAPLPSVIFAAHYSRMAAEVRNKLGFGPVMPKRESIPTVVIRAAAQAIVVAAGLIPVLAVLKVLPFFGNHVGKILAAGWALHWVVVDAFDDARVLRPGQTQRMLERESELAPHPWFVRFFENLGHVLPIVGGPLRWFSRILDKFTKSFREECALIERYPAIAAGFAATTGLLLAVPGLNLFFRPIIIVASAHLLGHLEKTEPHALPMIEAQPLQMPPGLKLSP
jgi:uncharacterized protein involved in cysteine biosynthesis